jgi:type IV pilus assembly protein PilW
LTLIEVMLVVTLSALLLVGLLTVLHSSRLMFNENSRVLRVQESARTGFEVLLRDLRAASYRGCTRELTTPDFVDVSRDELPKVFLLGYGVEDSVTAGTAAFLRHRLPGTDALLVRTPNTTMPELSTLQGMADARAALAVSAPIGVTFHAEQTLLVSDCEQSAVFTLDRVSASGSALLLHPATPGIGLRFAADARVQAIDTVGYFVGPAQQVGKRSLFRVTALEPPQELIADVDRVELRYGVDADRDAVIDGYVAAASVANWQDVAAVTVRVLLRTSDPTATWLTSTVALRNRLS